MEKMKEYIDRVHSGNAAAFSREINRKPQNVCKMLKSNGGWHVVFDDNKKHLVQVRVTF